MVGWHHQCNGQTPGGGEGQGSLECCRPRGHGELDTTGRLNNKEMLVPCPSPSQTPLSACLLGYSGGHGFQSSFSFLLPRSVSESSVGAFKVDVLITQDVKRQGDDYH